MPAIINSDNGVVSGSAGLKTSGANDGILDIQTNGSTAMSVNASQQVTFNNGANLPNTFGFKNRIINGNMVIDQRNAGASFSPTTTSGYSLDRWVARITQNSKLTIQQNAGSVTPPAGFTNYLGVTSSSAYSVLSTDVFTLAQAIEGFNVADLNFGSASAATVTLSFWVRSSLTGSFGGALINSASNRSYPFSYTINAANTWEQKTVTIAGDTSGTWLTNSSTGIEVRFGLGAGSNYTGTANTWGTANAAQPPSTVSVVGTNGATFYITGVQLEKGSTATSFDYRDYGRELMMCQRYYYKISTQSIYGIRYGGTSPFFNTGFPVTMRATPTVTPTLVSTIFTSAGTVSSLPIKDTTADSVSIQVNTSNVSVDFGITYNYTASIEL
jgi:hypothetical protein